MAIVRKKTKSGFRYMVRVKDRHQKHFAAKTFERKQDAERYETQLKLRRDQGHLAHGEEVRKATFFDYFTLWAAKMRSHISAGWKLSQDQMARDHILPIIGHKKLLNLRPLDIQEVMHSVEKKGLSEQTMLHVYNLMHKCFDDAVHIAEYLERNPVLKKFKPKPRNKTRNHLRPSDLFRLLEHCRYHVLGPCIWLASIAGLRCEAIQALTWDAIDFERGFIEIRQAYKRKIQRIEPYPKGRDHAKVPLPPMLGEYLQELRQESHSPLVASDEDGLMLRYERIYKGVRGICRELDLTIVTLHELRHSCTELWIEQGANIEDLRRLLNHKSAKTTERYIHRTDQRLEQIGARIGRSIGISSLQIE